MIKDNTGYAGAIILVMSTILMSFIIVIGVMPVHDAMAEIFTDQLIDSNNQFYSTTIAARLSTAGALGWKAPIGFIAIGFLYAIVRTIKRQQYTRYNDNEY